MPTLSSTFDVLTPEATSLEDLVNNHVLSHLDAVRDISAGALVEFEEE